MKALINLNEEAKYVSSFDNKNKPIYTIVGKRVCEVAENEFEVAFPLFWLDCNNEVIADLYYYDENTKSILIKPLDLDEFPIDVNTENQPITTGTQTI